MTGRRHEPLDAQERELARRLAQLDANAAPSPALDAAILAAARADGADRGATAATGARRRPPATRRRPRGWPMGLGIAASLAVAVGVAWQLRPQSETRLLVSPSDTAPRPAAVLSEPRTRRADPASQAPADAADSARASAAAVAPGESDRSARGDGSPASQTAPARAAQTGAGTDIAGAAAATDALAAEAEREQAEFQQAARARAAAAGSAPANADDLALGRLPPPPAPPAPPASPAPAEPGFAPDPPQASAAARPDIDARARALTPQQQAARASAERLDQIVVSGSRIAPPDAVDAQADQPVDDQPPASADSPAVREAWLQRVRELRDAGDVEAARASLREFARRHPQAKVPDDLRALLGG